MQALWSEWQVQLPASLEILVYAHLLLLLTWPVFLWMEKRRPVVAPTTARSTLFNWKVIASNLVLTPACYALSVAATATLGRALGLPAFGYPLLDLTTGVAALDLLFHGAALFLVACFLGDAWYYWWHRKQHEWPFLWELHKLHHSDEQLNATTIFRSHFLELPGQAMVRGLTVGLVVDLGGAGQTTVAIVAAGLLPPIWDVFIHANVRVDALHRWTPFFSTPQYHWIHHSKERVHQDKNYAIWLPLFDRLFGTYYAPAVDEYPPTGLSSGERIETLRDAQLGPLAAWARALAGSRVATGASRES